MMHKIENLILLLAIMLAYYLLDVTNCLQYGCHSILLNITDFFSPAWWKIADFFSTEWWKGVGASIIGGSIGGLVTYTYVIHTENKRETQAIRRENNKDEWTKKEKCTSTLLSTQMALSFQMSEIKGIEALTNNILNFNLSSGHTLQHHLGNISSAAEMASILLQFVKTGECSMERLMPLANYRLVHPPTNSIITLPYEVFEIRTISLQNKTIAAELPHYFQDLFSCNTKYFNMILMVMRDNETRDFLLNQQTARRIAETYVQLPDKDLYEYLFIVAGIFFSALKLKEMIPTYLQKATDAFSKTSNYIEFLGVSEPIKAEQDDDGQPTFGKN